MSLSIGIIGLPNVGKSTTFNALVQKQNAQVANYPFCTIEPNIAVVPVPDKRLEQLAEIVNVGRIIYSTVEFVDIAGLVKGASKGEGLGNHFLGHIRDVDALVHVIRCFEDENVAHINSMLDPVTDIEIIEIELALADLQQLERKMEKLERQVKGDQNLRFKYQLAQSLVEYLENGNSLRRFSNRFSSEFIQLDSEMRFLTSKPVIFLANVDEDGLSNDNQYYLAAKTVADENNCKILKLCSQLEQDVAELPNDEKQEYFSLLDISDSGLRSVITQSQSTLGLINFFSFNEDEARAWTIQDGWKAPQAAGVIHTDFEKGFIRAEVSSLPDFVEYQSWSSLRSAGLVKSEGREYVVKDGDIIKFLFNV